jgi:hypothetical protein
MSEPSRRATVTFSDESAAAADALTLRRGITLTELVRRAVSHEKFLDDAVQRGAKVLIQEPDGSVRELVLTL